MGDHSSRRRIAPPLKRPTRAAFRKEAGIEALSRPYSVLLPVGFTVPWPLPADAVRFYRTLSLSRDRSLRDLLSVALSLDPPPKRRTRRTLSGTVFRGARTFLAPPPI